VSKPTKTRAELEAFIVGQVRSHPDCEDFRSIAIRRQAVNTRRAHAANWIVSGWIYGNADMDACDAILCRIIPQLQRQYDLGKD
jgi:hypothetical protein